MKTLALAFLLLTLVPAPAALAHRHHPIVVGSCCRCWDSPACWGPRCSAEAARFTITSKVNDGTLVEVAFAAAHAPAK